MKRRDVVSEGVAEIAKDLAKFYGENPMAVDPVYTGAMKVHKGGALSPEIIAVVRWEQYIPLASFVMEKYVNVNGGKKDEFRGVGEKSP